jgi:NAD(P)-dependent dehydrogenase (short-subunit alcohol dehydrogenase family)
MRDSNVANAAKESAQAEFPHGLSNVCTTAGASYIILFPIPEILIPRSVRPVLQAAKWAKWIFSDRFAREPQQSRRKRRGENCMTRRSHDNHRDSRGRNCKLLPNRLWRRSGEQCNPRNAPSLGEDILTSLFDLTGRVAIVTGSSRGIGRAIAERLAEHGATVIISSRKADACDETAAAINRACGREAAKPIAANISSKQDLQRLVDETNKAFGRIDILVCNAASNPYYGPMAGISDEQFRKILENNVLANHWLIQMAAPGMLERNDGSIVIISSIGGLKGSPVIGAYNVSKAADIQLARNLAVEWGQHNVRVNCIAPGLIRTDFARALWENPQTLKAVNARTPLGRIGEVDEIAGAAVYLASKAGSFMTGQTIVIDGGATIAG